MKEHIKNILRRLGYKLVHLKGPNDIWHLIDGLLAKHDVNILLDVGANKGQFLTNTCRVLRHNFQKIYSFEPLPEAYIGLLKTIERLGASSEVQASNIALGSQTTKSTIHVAPNSVSSSLLKPSSEFKKMLNMDIDPTFEELEIFVHRFDEVAVELDSPLVSGADEKYFLKLDVQGFEKHVLDGFGKHIDNVKVALVECSFEESYKDRPLLSDIISYMLNRGFHVAGIFPGYYNKDKYQLFEVDVVFAKDVADG